MELQYMCVCVCVPVELEGTHQAGAPVRFCCNLDSDQLDRAFLFFLGAHPQIRVVALSLKRATATWSSLLSFWGVVAVPSQYLGTCPPGDSPWIARAVAETAMPARMRVALNVAIGDGEADNCRK